MIRTAALLVIALLLNAPTHAQTRSLNKLNLSRPYWLQYSLVFYEGHTPRVFPNNIIFIQGASPDDARWDGIKRRGTKIKIYSVSDEKGFTRVKFRHWPEIYELETEYEVFLIGNTKRSFQKAFALLFSDREVRENYDCPGEVRTRKEAIRCLGFPMMVTRDGDTEEFHYILEFVGPNIFNSFDGFTLKIKGNKIIDMSGYI